MEQQELGKTLDEISDSFNQAMKGLESVQEAFWNSLSKDEQLKAFCAVVRRIHRGEIEEGRSYRGVLYDTFGFGPESYAQAQMAGYLALHNSIFDMDQERDTLKAFAQQLGVEDSEQAVHNFYKSQL
jgi:hypothetical protein